MARLADVLNALVEPVIVVGHSSGGMLISALAEQRPKMVRGLVYLAAFLLPPGVAPPAMMRADTESMLRGALVLNEVRGSVSVNREALKEVF